MTLGKRLRAIRDEESGLMLIEVLVASILIVLVADGVFGAFEAATRTTAQERHRAQAHAIADAVRSRMRSMRISDLSNLNQTRTVNQDGTPYSVHSTAVFLTDNTSTASCEAGTASADYIKVSSTVTWPSIGSRPPVVSSTIVAPPNGSISANSGALAVGIVDSRDVGIGGIGIAGSGAGSFSGVTGSNGCAIFGNLPAGAYTLSFTGVSVLVDKDGNVPGSQQTSVVAESTNTLVLQFDHPGTITTTFETKPYGATASTPPVASSADSVIVFNTGMTSTKAFPPTPGARVASITSTALFPFSSDYAVYAGTCEGDNPNPLNQSPPPAPLATASVLLSPAGSPSGVVRLPSLQATVYEGANPTSPRAVGAHVKITDTLCGNYTRTFTTNANGQLDDPGVPYSDYIVCADGVVAGVTRRRIVSPNPSLNDPADVDTGTDVDIPLQGTGSTTGACP